MNLIERSTLGPSNLMDYLADGSPCSDLHDVALLYRCSLAGLSALFGSLGTKSLNEIPHGAIQEPRRYVIDPFSSHSSRRLGGPLRYATGRSSHGFVGVSKSEPECTPDKFREPQVRQAADVQPRRDYLAL